MLKYAITQKYEQLVESLRKIGEEANCGNVMQHAPVQTCFSSNEHGDVFFDCLLFLKEWRWKGVSRHEKVNILLRAKETIVRKNLKVKTSSVNVNYFKSDSGELLQAFHYDHDPTQVDHPIYHMQVTDRSIELSQDEADAFGLKAEVLQTPPLLRCARVPTCDMTLASVLLCLVADHIGGHFFKAFFDTVCELQSSLPRTFAKELTQGVSAGENANSPHWFRHF